MCCVKLSITFYILHIISRSHSFAHKGICWFRMWFHVLVEVEHCSLFFI